MNFIFTLVKFNEYVRRRPVVPKSLIERLLQSGTANNNVCSALQIASTEEHINRQGLNLFLMSDLFLATFFTHMG